jgi:hypothetical protein
MVCIHHWHIDADDVGQCQNCKRVKDLGKLLKRESKKLKGKAFWPPRLLNELAEDLAK